MAGREPSPHELPVSDQDGRPVAGAGSAGPRGSQARSSASSLRVIVAPGERGRWARAGRLAAVGLTVVVASGLVLVGGRLLAGEQPSLATGTGTPAAVLDARSATPAPTGTAEPAPVPGSARLALLGPLTLLDGRGARPLRAGAEVTVPLPDLPRGSTAVLLEVSLLDAVAPGAVTVASGGDRVTALRLPRRGAQLTATTVVRLAPDSGLRAATEGGGRLVVRLVGAFEPAGAATAGRIVPVPATQVLRLVPDSDGKRAAIDLTSVAALRETGSVAAVMLQVSADVGRRGGFVAVGPAADRLDQEFFWMATTSSDRVRAGFLVVPVTGDELHVRYVAGDELRVDLVGYVTDGTAARSGAGLAVPVPPVAGPATRVPAGRATDVAVVPSAVAGVPPERVAATLVQVAATGDAAGEVTVHAPGSAAPPNPTLSAARGVARPAVTLVTTVDGAVRVASRAGASVTLTPLALVLG